jgi:hypothetical protein
MTPTVTAAHSMKVHMMGLLGVGRCRAELWPGGKPNERSGYRGRDESDGRLDEVEFGLDVRDAAELDIEDGLLLVDLVDLSLHESTLLRHFRLERGESGCEGASHRDLLPLASVATDLTRGSG